MKHQIQFSSLFMVLAIALMLTLTACSLGQQTNTITGQATAQPAQLQHVRIGYLPVSQGLPLYLALEKGYFTDAGIDVEAVKFDSPNLLVQALASGQVDMGAPSTASGITAIAERAKPGEFKIYAGGGSSLADEHINEGFIVQKDSSIESITDLKGKKIGILPSIQWRTIAKHILAQKGISADKDVTLVELAPGLQVQALATGQVDALLAIEPVPTIAKKKGIGKEIEHGSVELAIADPLYAGAGVVTTTFINKDPQLASKTVAVLAKSIDEVNANYRAAVVYMPKYTALNETLINDLPQVIFKNADDFTEQDIDSFQTFFNIFTEHGVIDAKVDAESMIYGGK